MSITKSGFSNRLRNRPQNSPPPVPSSKESLDVFSGLLGIAAKGALAFGLVTLIFYLGAAQHIVTGANLTEGILLAALALVLGILGVSVLIVGTMLVFPQMNFFLLAMASGASFRHLSRIQKWRAYGFCTAVGVYSLAMPWTIRELLIHGHEQYAIGTIAVAGTLAGILAMGWTRIHQVCLRSSSHSSGRMDALSEGVNACVLLWMSPLIWAMVSLILPFRICLVLSAIGFFNAIGLSLMLSSGNKVLPSWRVLGRTLLAFCFVVSTIISIFVPAFGGETGVLKAFQGVALNVPQATLAVSPANLERLERVAAQHGRSLNVCRNADGSATITDVRVLWHTLGTNGLVELWSEPTDPKHYVNGSKAHFRTSLLERWFNLLGWRGVRVPLENSGLAVITGSNLHCLELDGLLFETNASVLGEKARTVLQERLGHMLANVQQVKNGNGLPVRTIQRIEVVGHADPRRRFNGTNEELAAQRAESVKAAVQAWIHADAPEWRAAVVSTRSEGSREQARKCDSNDAAENQACNAFNRRVVIRMISTLAD